jgi:hypothetical protein
MAAVKPLTSRAVRVYWPPSRPEPPMPQEIAWFAVAAIGAALLPVALGVFATRRFGTFKGSF